jgi:hypothetical protein
MMLLQEKECCLLFVCQFVTLQLGVGCLISLFCADQGFAFDKMGGFFFLSFWRVHFCFSIFHFLNLVGFSVG